MKKNYKNIEQEVEQTLQCLKPLKPLKHQPFFYRRLQERLEQEKNKKLRKISIRLLQPAIMILLALVNFGIVFLIWDNGDPKTQYRDSRVTDFANEYTLEHEMNDPFDINGQE